MYKLAERSDIEMLAMLLPDHDWSSIHTFSRADKLPHSRLFILVNRKSQAYELCLMPLVYKATLDRAVRYWRHMQGIISYRRARRRRFESHVKLSPCGRFAYLLMPLITRQLVKNNLSLLTLESLIQLTSDISNLLYWLHRQPLDLRLSAAEGPVHDYVETLWMLADSGHATRHEVNRLNRLAIQCQEKRTPARRTPVFCVHTPTHLWLDELNRLRRPYPPYICAGDPWLDLARHLMLFEDKLLPFRELIVNTYFDLNPPTSFFNTLFLYELNTLGKTWQSEHENSDEGVPTLSQFASRYESGSPIPNWYET